MSYTLPPDIRIEKTAVPLSELIDWSQKLIGLPEVWKEHRGDGVTVAILDTGCDVNHQDLRGQIVDAKDFTDSIYDYDDRHGHGTWCTGFCVATGNNTGIRGCMYGGKSLVGKVLGDQGYGSSKSIQQGVEWAHSKKADIISMSLGGSRLSSGVHRAIRDFTADGGIVVAAAGNDGGKVNYPGAYKETIGVGAVDSSGRMTDFTSRGPELDILAPGQDMLSTVPGNQYAKMTGTSMATPVVASVVGLIKSSGLSWDVIKLRKQLRETGDTTGSGYRLIDPDELLSLKEEEESEQQFNLGYLDIGPVDIVAGKLRVRIYGDLR